MHAFIETFRDYVPSRVKNSSFNIIQRQCGVMATKYLSWHDDVPNLSKTRASVRGVLYFVLTKTSFDVVHIVSCFSLCVRPWRL